MVLLLPGDLKSRNFIEESLNALGLKAVEFKNGLLSHTTDGQNTSEDKNCMPLLDEKSTDDTDTLQQIACVYMNDSVTVSLSAQ